MLLVSPSPGEMRHEMGGRSIAFDIKEQRVMYVNSDKLVLMRKGKNKEKTFIGRLDPKQGLTEVSF